MSRDIDRKEVPGGRVFIKPFILLLLAAISIGFVEFSSLREYLASERFQRTMTEPGLLSPALLALFCMAGTCLFIPGTLFVGLGALLFGPYLGFVCVWTGALFGALIAFLTTRLLGREFVTWYTPNRLKKYDGLIEQNGFKAVLLLRLVCVPFAPASYGLGLTSVRLSDYLLGTALGTAVTIFILIFFFSAIKDVWLSGDYALLFSARPALAALFLLTAAIIIRRVHKKYEKSLDQDA